MRLYDYAASGNCYKARLLIALTGRDVELMPVDIFAGDTLTDAFGALNPLRETPVLELDSGEVITQSNAILWYLAEGTPFMPDERARPGSSRSVALVRAGARDERCRRGPIPDPHRPAARGRAGEARART